MFIGVSLRRQTALWPLKSKSAKGGGEADEQGEGR